MILRRFSLLPFPGDRGGPETRITGSIVRRKEALSVAWMLLADLPEIVLPSSGEAPGRKERLWQETCVELFLGAKGSGSYREFNLSTAGHWNVYRFDGYREGMREDPAITSLPFAVRIGKDCIGFSLELSIGDLIPPEATIEAGVAAVVRTANGGTVHWALAHPAPRPDFHRRESFLLELPPG